MVRNRYILLADLPLIAIAAFGACALRFDWLFLQYRPELVVYLAAALSRVAPDMRPLLVGISRPTAGRDIERLRLSLALTFHGYSSSQSDAGERGVAFRRGHRPRFRQWLPSLLSKIPA
jgi:hypothetical protein